MKARKTQRKAKSRHIGSTFESFLEEEGLIAEVTATAIKRVIAWQMSEAMKRDGISKAEMARRMNTSRAALDRLLDPDNSAVTLHTIGRAASVLGKTLRVEIADAPAVRAAEAKTRKAIGQLEAGKGKRATTVPGLIQAVAAKGR